MLTKFPYKSVQSHVPSLPFLDELTNFAQRGRFCRHPHSLDQVVKSQVGKIIKALPRTCQGLMHQPLDLPQESHIYTTL